jgi:SpoIID/LytB domain protein
MAASGELCDYDLCQVYIGADRESAGQSAAVDATSGEVVTYASGLASTVYSADAGGTSATPHEGFGSSDAPYPYLTTVRYDTPNPLPWHVQVALTDLANRLGYRGALQGVSIGDAGPSGRALAVHLDGTAGAQDVDGHQFAQSLGLRSTLFTPTVGTATSAPAAPDASAGSVQALPDDAAALSRAARAGSSERGTASKATAQRLEAVNREAASTAPGPLGKAIDLTHQAATWVALIALALVTMAAVGVGTGALPRFAMARPDQPQLIRHQRSRSRGRPTT